MNGGDTTADPAHRTLRDRLQAAFPRRRDAGYVVEVVWHPDNAAIGVGRWVTPSWEYVGKLRGTPGRAQRQADRIRAYWRRGPVRPATVGVVYKTRLELQEHRRHRGASAPR